MPQAHFDFIEGWDLYTPRAVDSGVSDAYRLWETDGSSFNGIFAGRNGGNSFGIENNITAAVDAFIQQAAGTNYSYLICAMRSDDNSDPMTIRFENTSLNRTWRIGYDENMFACLWRGSTLAIQSASNFSLGTWNVFEMLIDRTGMTEQATLWVNGQLVDSVMNPSTDVGAFDVIRIRKFEVQSTVTSTTWYIDDIGYCADPDFVNDLPLGDIAILPLVPDADSTPQDFNLIGGSALWDLIEGPGATTGEYGEAQSVNDVGSVELSDYSEPDPAGFVHTIQSQIRAWDDDAAGTYEFQAFLDLPVKGTVTGTSKGVSTAGGRYYIDTFSGGLVEADLSGIVQHVERTA